MNRGELARVALRPAAAFDSRLHYARRLRYATIRSPVAGLSEARVAGLPPGMASGSSAWTGGFAPIRISTPMHARSRSMPGTTACSILPLEAPIANPIRKPHTSIPARGRRAYPRHPLRHAAIVSHISMSNAIISICPFPGAAAQAAASGAWKRTSVAIGCIVASR